MPKPKKHVLVCVQGRPAGHPRGSCHLGPSVLVYPEGIMYTGVKPEDVATIVDEHLLFDQPVARLKAPADVWA